MNENRLTDYLHHMEQAATDACGFVEGLATSQRMDLGRQPAARAAHTAIRVAFFEFAACR